MLEEKSKQQIAPAVRTAQIILSALATGVFMFAMVILFVIGGQQGPGNMLTSIAVVVAGTNWALSLVIPPLIAANGRRKIAAGTWQTSPNQGPLPDTDAGKLMMVYQTKMIVAAALLEGGCFLALYAYMTERLWPSLATAAFLLLCMLAHFPTLDRVEAWIDEQLRRVEEERQLSR